MSGTTELQPAFALHGVRLERGGAVVLDGVDLAIPDGRVTALIGPSGSGKTSLLRLLNRLDDPDGGEVAYRGRPLTEYPPRLLRRRVGFVFQTPVMFAGTVRDNLEEAARIAGAAGPDLAARLEEAMRLAELDPALADRSGARLSVGEKQRANLARALMTAPEALLLDEPTASLDPETAVQLVDTVRRLSRERGLTIVMATHRLTEARRASDHTTLLESGRVVETGPTQELFEHAGNPRTAEFLARGQ